MAHQFFFAPLNDPMDASFNLARHVARFMSLLRKQPDAVDQQKLELRALMLMTKEATLRLSTREGQLVANGLAVPSALAGVRDLADLMVGHRVESIEIAREMIGHGRSPQTPAMAVRWATRPDQQTIVGTLGDLADKLEQAHMRPPATIVIGEVVSLRERFNWFEKLPLFGQRIIVTRDRRQSPLLAEPLEGLGAETLFAPVIEIVAGEASSLERAIAQLDKIGRAHV